jgi:hypothetical protein
MKNKHTETLRRIALELNALAAELENEQLDMKLSNVEQTIQKCDAILSMSDNAQIIKFISGIKDFAENAGFLSQKQTKSVDVTFDRVCGYAHNEKSA